MEFIAYIYEKTNKGAFFRGEKIIEANSIEEAREKAKLPKDLEEFAMVEVCPRRSNAEE